MPALRPDLSLFIGILGIVILAALLTGCAETPRPDVVGGLGWDMLGIAIQGIAGAF